jgi:GAF domain-containing protein
MSVDARVLGASLQRLRTSGDQDLQEVLDQVVTACVGVFGVTGAGLMVADEQNSLRYVSASDGPGRILEKVQTDRGEGPCVDAFVHNRVIVTDDLAHDARWPETRGVLVEHGIGAVLGIPVRLGGIVVGSLDVYHGDRHDWQDAEIAALTRYGEVVQATLQAALTAHRAGELAEQLQYALDYRVIIERSVGYLMAAKGVDAVAAFDLLRRTARGNRRKIGDVAHELLDTGNLPI